MKNYVAKCAAALALSSLLPSTLAASASVSIVEHFTSVAFPIVPENIDAVRSVQMMGSTRAVLHLVANACKSGGRHSAFDVSVLFDADKPIPTIPNGSYVATGVSRLSGTPVPSLRILPIEQAKKACAGTLSH